MKPTAADLMDAWPEHEMLDMMHDAIADWVPSQSDLAVIYDCAIVGDVADAIIGRIIRSHVLDWAKSNSYERNTDFEDDASARQRELREVA